MQTNSNGNESEVEASHTEEAVQAGSCRPRSRMPEHSSSADSSPDLKTSSDTQYVDSARRCIVDDEIG